ncbi:hypothetical protein H6H01_36305 [Nostoc calcicola FACHB-3891]|uniref:hypothetical protein n=1 Tax=Anabaena sp. FACHB-83 TaxID=2692772 RepID=UPI001686C859|nr:hypothetical protein [Anabaena sp. FACHB-83]MBD2416074.1 hypothetical protein [Nostoc calcicola FACHB-3891]MBD2475140.1 hypothetical protein [Anabaena sp. FACHB-83]
MAYKDKLRPWHVYRCRVSGNVCVTRHRTRGDAYAYLSILRMNNPGAVYEVVFDKEPAEVQ